MEFPGISGGPLIPQGAKGAFPERGHGRAKTRPDAGCAQRDSGVTRSVTYVARSATPE